MEVYTNNGHGTVLRNDNTIEQVRELFNQRDEWFSAELDKKVGWQFSQAVYFLRQDGLNIKCIRHAQGKFSYRLFPGKYEVPRRMVRLKDLADILSPEELAKVEAHIGARRPRVRIRCEAV